MLASIALVSFIVLVIYIFQVSRYFLANFRCEKTSDVIKPTKTVAVIIPFRNESDHIESLTNSLFAQKYPKDLLEFIFVDDHSEDQSLSILKTYCESNIFKVKVLSLTERIGKKAALKEGVEASTSEFIITCDADCTMKSKWIASMVNCLESNNTFVIGPVQFNLGNSIFENLQQIEFSAIMACTSGAAFINKAISCNGANLGYNRLLYNEIQPYEIHSEIASGDDVFFLFAAKKAGYNSAIGFVASDSAVVTTKAASNLKDFVNQRVRWAKKSKYFNDWNSKMFGLLIIGINILLLFLGISSILNHEFFLIFITCFTLKMLVDYLLLLSDQHWNPTKNPLFKTILLSLIYPFYLLFIALLSLLHDSKWKGRNL